MAVSVNCPRCRMIFTTASANGGRQFECKKCRTAVQFPQAAADSLGDESSLFGACGGDWQDAPPVVQRKPKKKRRSVAAPPGFLWREFGKLGLGLVGYVAVCGVIYLEYLLFLQVHKSIIEQINEQAMEENRERWEEWENATRDLRQPSIMDDLRGSSPGGSHSGSSMHGGGRSGSHRGGSRY